MESVFAVMAILMTRKINSVPPVILIASLARVHSAQIVLYAEIYKSLFDT